MTSERISPQASKTRLLVTMTVGAQFVFREGGDCCAPRKVVRRAAATGGVWRGRRLRTVRPRRCPAPDELLGGACRRGRLRPVARRARRPRRSASAWAWSQRRGAAEERRLAAQQRDHLDELLKRLVDVERLELRDRRGLPIASEREHEEARADPLPSHIAGRVPWEDRISDRPQKPTGGFGKVLRMKNGGVPPGR